MTCVVAEEEATNAGDGSECENIRVLEKRHFPLGIQFYVPWASRRILHYWGFEIVVSFRRLWTEFEYPKTDLEFEALSAQFIYITVRDFPEKIVQFLFTFRENREQVGNYQKSESEPSATTFKETKRDPLEKNHFASLFADTYCYTTLRSRSWIIMPMSHFQDRFIVCRVICRKYVYGLRFL